MPSLRALSFVGVWLGPPRLRSNKAACADVWRSEAAFSPDAQVQVDASVGHSDKGSGCSMGIVALMVLP